MRNILIILFALIGLDALAYGPWIFGNNNTSVQVPFTQKAAIGTDSTSGSSMLTIAGQRGVTAPITGTNLHISGADGTESNLLMDAYGSASSIISRRSNGTQSSPTALQSGNNILFLGARGYGATGYSAFSMGALNIVAGENWTDSSQGTSLRLETTASGSTSRATRLNIDVNGSVSIGNGTTAANTSSILDITSTTKGFLPPRQTTAQKTAIASPATGLEVYDTTLNQKQVYNGFSWDAGSVNIGYPVVKPTLLLDFANSRTLDPRITFTRATTRTCVNSRGLIETLAAGVPCFDHDPTTQESLGLLVEESAINIILQNETFDNASWAKTRLNAGTPVVANDIASPDGTATADRLVEDNTTGAHLILQTPTIVNATTYTLSIFAKAGTRSQFHLVGGATTLYGKLFDLSAGTVAADQVAGVSDAPSGSIKAYPNGWYRCTITFVSDGTSGNMQVRLYNAADSYLGDNASGLYLWGAQLEARGFQTSYSGVTTTTAFTRNADQASMTGTNFSSWYRADEGTFVSKARARVGITDGNIFRANDGTSNNVLLSRVNSSSFTDSRSVVSGVNQAVLLNSSSVAGNLFNTTFGYKLNDFAASTNGSTPSTDVSGTVPTVDRIFVGFTGSSEYWNGQISQIYYYPKRLTNAELQAVTR